VAVAQAVHRQRPHITHMIESEPPPEPGELGVVTDFSDGVGFVGPVEPDEKGGVVITAAELVGGP